VLCIGELTLHICLFPLRLQAPETIREKNENGEELLCLCKRPYDSRRMMLGYTPGSLVLSTLSLFSASCSILHYLCMEQV
jgi:hypothetical protein